MTEASKQRVELLEKNKPQQARAKRTYESILESAAVLLVEVGVERISTNLVAERAGITVPAVYRYFPNKYAVLHALGARLMDKQNTVFQHWFDNHAEEGDPRTLLENVHDLLQETHYVTQQATGGREIVQALRAVTPLQELRLESHRLIADQFALTVASLLGREQDELVKTQAHLSIDLGYAIVEMMLEERGASTELLLQEGARMIQLYWQGVFGLAPKT